MRRTSISSIPAGIQRPCSISKVTPEAELLIPSLPVRGIAVSSISIPKRSTRFAVFVAISVVLSSLFSPATASDQNSPAVLTSQLPWLAPTGHRQPRRADVPQEESLSGWERQQLFLDRELDRNRSSAEAADAPAALAFVLRRSTTLVRLPTAVIDTLVGARQERFRYREA